MHKVVSLLWCRICFSCFYGSSPWWSHATPLNFFFFAAAASFVILLTCSMLSCSEKVKSYGNHGLSECWCKNLAEWALNGFWRQLLEITSRWRIPVQVEKQKVLVSSRNCFSFQFKAQFALCFSPPPSVTNIDQHVMLRSLLASFALDEQCKLQQCCSSLIYFDYSREDIYLRENMCALGTAAQFLDNIDFCLAIWSIWAGGECAHSENRWVGVTWRPRKWLC